jgi:hypothetical protein
VDSVLTKGWVGRAGCKGQQKTTQSDWLCNSLARRGLQVVEVWADTRAGAARARAATERALENIGGVAVGCVVSWNDGTAGEGGLDQGSAMSRSGLRLMDVSSRGEDW